MSEVEDVEIAEMCGAAFEAFEAYRMLVSSSDGKDLKQLSRQPWLDDRGAGLRHVDRILNSRPPRIVNFLRMTGPCFH